jgi:hypothetical protein
METVLHCNGSSSRGFVARQLLVMGGLVYREA